MEPFVKLYRKFLEWEWYSDINTSRLFLHLLLKANWKQGSFKGKTIERGELVSSLDALSRETGLTVNEIRTGIKHLKSTGEITSKSYSKFTVFTVVRYNSYQDINKQSTSTDAGTSHPVNTLLTTIEEVKKERSKDIKDIVVNAAEPKFDDESFEVQCVDRIIKSCLEGFPKSKVPVSLDDKQKWAIDIERMKRLDKLTEMEITQVLDFALVDSFWKTSIRSAKKFREKFEMLYTQMKRQKPVQPVNKNKFNNFPQRKYDFGDLEKQLLSQ